MERHGTLASIADLGEEDETEMSQPSNGQVDSQFNHIRSERRQRLSTNADITVEVCSFICERWLENHRDVMSVSNVHGIAVNKLTCDDVKTFLSKCAKANEKGSTDHLRIEHVNCVDLSQNLFNRLVSKAIWPQRNVTVEEAVGHTCFKDMPSHSHRPLVILILDEIYSTRQHGTVQTFVNNYLSSSLQAKYCSLVLILIDSSEACGQQLACNNPEQVRQKRNRWDLNAESPSNVSANGLCSGMYMLLVCCVQMLRRMPHKSSVLDFKHLRTDLALIYTRLHLPVPNSATLRSHIATLANLGVLTRMENDKFQLILQEKQLREALKSGALNNPLVRIASQLLENVK